MNSHVQFNALSSSLLATERPRRLLQNHDTLMTHVQLGLSVLASVALLLALAMWRDGTVETQYRSLAIIIGLMMSGIYHWRGVYRRFNGRLKGSLRLARSWTLLVTAVIFVVFITKSAGEFSRAVILGWAALGLCSQILVYQMFYGLSQYLKASSQPARRALIVGSHELASHLLESVNRNSWVQDRIVGVLTDQDLSDESIPVIGAPFLGTLERLLQTVADQKISRVYIALPIEQSVAIQRVCALLGNSAIDIIWVPDIFSLRLLNHSVKELNGLPLITLSESPLASESQAFLKLVMDRTIALMMLLVLSPLMLCIAFLVWQSSPGPIIFKQKRNGWDGRIIEVWKFRSMYVHNDQQVCQAQRNDSRITPIGRFIRRTSIDELPQLFNVLEGSMSLVGPRPHAVSHNEFYASKIPEYMLRHRIKPGITGLAQVNGLRGETETLEKMLLRVEQDILYINRWSVGLDLLILLKTPFSLLGKNAY